MKSSGPWLRAAGWLLLLVPFIPLAWIFDDPPGTTWLIDPGEWMLGLAVFGVAAWLIVRIAPDLATRAADGVARGIARPRNRAFRLAGLAVLAALLVVTSTFAFSNGPLLIDSIIQLFQAKIFAAGDAYAPAPAHEGFFATQHMLVDGDRWYSQYPPGHPAALALGVWIGAPWLVPIVLSLGSAWLIVDTTRRLFGETEARAALLILLVAPFFWFMGASFMNHVTALFFVTLFLWAVVRWEASGTRPPWIALAGAALGGAFLVRPLTAVAVGLALSVPAIRIAGRRWWSAGLVGAASFAALAVFYFLFNAWTTGDPFTAGYVKLWGAEHGLGFHATPWGDQHTPLTGLRNELIDLALLNAFLFEWGIPALFPLGLFLAPGWAGRPWEGRLAGAFFAIPAAYFFYWHRDDFLGPRYVYEGLAFLVPLFAVSMIAVGRRLRGRALVGADAGLLFATLVGLSFGYSLLYAVPQRFRVYATSLESVKRDLVAEAEAAGVREGLVFVAVSWGNRMIARARAAGATASTAEVVYHATDHCELELVVRAAEREGWPAERVNREMRAIMRPEDDVVETGLTEDRTLRLVPDRPLDEACRREILYDRQGFTNFSPHLPRNRPDLGGPYVFARDLADQNHKLRALYPELPAYLYRSGEFAPLP